MRLPFPILTNASMPRPPTSSTVPVNAEDVFNGFFTNDLSSKQVRSATESALSSLNLTRKSEMESQTLTDLTLTAPRSKKLPSTRRNQSAEEVPAWSRWWFLAILFLYLIQPQCSLCPLWLNSETENLTSTYDDDGNLSSRSLSVSGKNQSLVWDGLGRLRKIEERNGSNDGFNWSAKYDGLNRRLGTTYQKITANIPSPGSHLLTTQSFFDPQVEFLEIGISVAGNTTDTYWKIYGPDLNERFGGLQGVGGLEAIYSGNETTGIISDSFGHAIARTDGTAVTWSDASLSGYGPLPGSWASPIHQSGDLATSVSWQGRYIDPTGYFCVGARYYEPNSGRFISTDPLGHEASMDLYSYANGDPINMADPDGRLASGFHSGATQRIGADAPDTWAFSLGMQIGAPVSGYYGGLWQGASQMVMGEYGNQTQTWNSVVGQIGVGLTPAGVAADIRDWSKAGTDFISGDGSWGSLGMATVFLAPGASEFGKTFKLFGESGNLLKTVPESGTFWQVGRHGDMPSPRPVGAQSHHGVNSVWMEANFPTYRAGDAPAVLMQNDPFHNATRGVFNRMRSEIAARQGVSPRNIDWSQVQPGTAWRLAEEQFEAAQTPLKVREEYFNQFNQYLNSQGR